MLKSSGAMGIATLSSRLLGMVREMCYSGFMGDGPVASAFQLAFMVPNLFRRLLGEGALTAAFIPIFKQKEKKDGERAMWHAANAVISGLIVASVLITIAVVLLISLVLALDSPDLISPGVVRAMPALAIKTASLLSPDTRLMLELSRIMFPYMIVITLTAIFMGILNARGHFFVPAMGATLLNIILIGIVVFVAPHWAKTLDRQIFALAFGVLVAGVIQALYQLPTLYRDGFNYRWATPWRDETVRQVVRKMVPGMMGVAAFQLNMLITQGMAYSVDPDRHIVASFGYAVRLMELPQGIFGLSLATFLLSSLSGFAAEKKYPEFRATLRQGLGYMALANLLASILLLVLSRPIIRLIYEHGKFGPLATDRASFALACLSPGLIAFSTVNILARAFYALGDTQTPMKISCVCLGLNIVFVLWLLKPLEQGGMGIANSMSACFNVWLLFYGLRRKLSRLELSELRHSLVTMLGAAIGAGEIAWLISRYWENHFGGQTVTLKIGAVFVPMIFATGTYFAVLLWLKVPQAADYFELVRARFRKRA
jgi:putative peptidoglycan lipid II flippase